MAPEAAAAPGQSCEQAAVVGGVGAGLDNEGAADPMVAEDRLEAGQRPDLVPPRPVPGALHEREPLRLQDVAEAVGDGPRHLSTLAVIPRMRRSERKAYTRTTGRMAIIMPVAIMPMSSSLSPMKRMIPSGSVRFSSSVTSTTAYRNSFHSSIRFRMIVVAMAGIPMGTVSRQNTPSSEQPSIFAASK